MKAKVLCGLLAVLVLVLCSGLASAQEAKSQMYLVYDCVTKPSTDAKLYEALKEMAAFYSKQAFPYSWDVYATGDYHYQYLIPVGGFADIEKFFKTDEAIMTKAAAEYQTLMDKFKDTYESYEFQVYTYRPDLSHIAANPYYKPEEMKFVALDVWSFIPGKEQEAETLCQEMMALCQKKGVRDSWYCYAGTLGVEQPVYVFAGPDKDEGEFIMHNAEMWKLLGKDIDDIFNKLIAICRKREYRRGWYQPELSYTPKK
jgi:hypothetical protein